MTPLAHELAKRLTLPLKQREPFFPDTGGAIQSLLNDAHFFEVTALWTLLPEIRAAVRANGYEAGSEIIGKFVFLPAPRTWIEQKHPQLGRYALLLEQNKAGTEASVRFVTRLNSQPIGSISLVSDDFDFVGGQYELPEEWHRFVIANGGLDRVFPVILGGAHWALLAINSPRIVGRKQHMPHAGLEKGLTKALGKGMFPLRGWTEIKLEIAKPAEIDDGEPHEAHLTGRRALHFCRKHIRIRLGRLEYVTAHWRGDPALGIKRSRYALTG